MQKSAPPSLIADLLERAAGIIPVITLADPTHARPTADVLSDAGCSVLEITLRTPAAVESIKRLCEERSDLVVGAGTVMNAAQAQDAASAGARFLVSPGFAPAVHSFCLAHNLPYLPGVATVTEAMAAAELGYRYLKLFPAEIAGGPALLKALGQVLPELKFCPTGGINAANAHSYQALDNVVCVGGSWLVPESV